MTLAILYAVAVVLSLIMWALDIHVAIYRPKRDRSTYFYLEIGNPETSEMGK